MIYEFKFPDLGEGLHEAEIVRWLVGVGSEVKKDEPLVEVQTDKSVTEIPSPAAGKVVSIIGEEGTLIRVGDVLVTIEQVASSTDRRDEATDTSQPEEAETTTKQNVSAIKSGGDVKSQGRKVRVKAAPTVRKLARELGINIEQVVGTGPHGRVTEEDVRSYSEQLTVANSENKQTAIEDVKADVHEHERRIEEVPFIGLRRTIAEKMVQSVTTIPHATGMSELDVTKLVEIRNSLKPHAEKYGCKLTYLPFIIKAVTKSLIENPYLNASLDEERGKILLKKYYNIGVATATKDGLVVPVIKDADKKTIIEIAIELEQLIQKTRERKIALSDLQDSTFTISSTGNFGGGGGFATPIINYPEVAILGVYAIQQKPVVLNGEITIRHMMGTALSFDHRVMDGLESARFMGTLAKILENPEILLLEVS